MYHAQNKTILVVEDEKSLKEVIASRLELNGFTVLTAREPSQALSLLLQEQKIDAIWLDHYLFGHENGLDLMKALRRNDKWKHIPVFVVSNTVSPEKAREYIEMGAAKYYIKVDYKLDDISSDINKVLAGGAL